MSIYYVVKSNPSKVYTLTIKGKVLDRNYALINNQITPITLGEDCEIIGWSKIRG